MDPKNTGIDPLIPASGGIVQEGLKLFTPGNGVNGGGVITAIMGFIPTAVDKYYAGDSERSIGRSATIVSKKE
ncbi:hypothetical protein [Flavobacterium sp. CSZ]|uniref:hypothetical protein n=1 Tax=Flavobacterium sp. CSZ TaxID=2783791 RepID=UPI00188C2996|nr:hypothetical protein [Flavobacterium sp. CSZ]MBF4485021.1 hypothetical protein [Flavobacterium sp. CSZ]